MNHSAPTIAMLDEAMVLRMTGAKPTANNTPGVDGILPNGLRLEIKSFSGSGRPSLGSMKDTETLEDAVKRLLVADVYALVAVDANGKYVHFMDHDAMLTFALGATGITRKASKRGGGRKVRFSRKPSR